MKDLIVFILNNIVDHPDDIQVDETTENDRTMVTIHVNPEDMGKVIGKQGRIIRSLRDLVKLIAAKRNIFADVVIAE